MTRGLSLTLEMMLALALCWAGSLVFGYLYVGRRLEKEVTQKDNAAIAIPYGGFMLSIMFILSAIQMNDDGALTWARFGVLAVWGLFGIVLLLGSSAIVHRMLYSDLGLWRKAKDKQSQAAGTIIAAIFVSSALIIRNAVSGEGGLTVSLVFWMYAQVLWIVILATFTKFSGYHLQYEMKRDNLALAFVYSGASVALANLLGNSISGDFVSWSESFAVVTESALGSLAFLYIIHKVADWVFLPNVTIHEEIISQKTPNIGVGVLIFSLYVGLSLLVKAVFP